MVSGLRGMIIVVMVLLPYRIGAESAIPWVFHSGATGAANGSELPAGYYSTVAVQIEGTFQGIVEFQKKTKDATSYVPVQCTDANDRSIVSIQAVEPGYWECPGGAFSFRAPVTSYTSGTIVVTGHATTAVISRGGGSGGGSAQGLDANFDLPSGNIITGTSEARRLDILGLGGQAANGATVFQHSDGNTYITCVSGGVVDDCNKIVRLPNTRYFQVNGAANTQMIRFDPSAPTAALQYTVGAGYYILYSKWIPADRLIGDGTNCPTSATGAVLNSGPRIRTFICADNNGSRLDGSFKMDFKWAGEQITVIQVVVQTAVNTAALLGHFTCQVRGNGVAPSSTWATEVPITASSVGGSSKNDFFTIDTPIQCNGTPAGGDMLYFKYELDATGTTTPTATLHHLGFLILFLGESLSE
ncbi:MAG: hypothetical protein OEY77_00210 [Nitrospira sp.]|nr:hypothetical protein [Nitrospira sp.]